jgi:hypothetical protein
MERLLQSTGLPASQIEHDLTCLYYAGAVTTTSTKAAAPTARQDSLPFSVGPGDDSISSTRQADYHYGLTAPVQLEEHRLRRPVTGASNDSGGSGG